MELLMRYSRIFICTWLVLSPALVCAQTTNSADSGELIRALLARVEQLEKRVAELEGRPGAPVAAAPQPGPAVAEAAAPNAAAPNQVVAAPEVHLGHGGAGPMTVPATHIAGFSDIDFAATDLHGAHSGFSEGQFVLHL